jgi:uncharacterized integral membrane protein
MRNIGRLLWASISAVTVGLAISITISNDTVISLSLWPFPQTLKVPTGILVITSFVTGGILSGGLMWLQMFANRAKLWRSQLQILKLQAQLERQKQESMKLKLLQAVEE